MSLWKDNTAPRQTPPPAPEPREPARFDAFEQLAWRTLGEALLLVDLYEQADGPSTLVSLAPPRPAGLRERVMGWWRVLAG